MKENKIVLSASQMGLLHETLVTALDEAPSSVKALIRNNQPLKLEEKKEETEKRTEEDWGFVF